MENLSTNTDGHLEILDFTKLISEIQVLRNKLKTFENEQFGHTYALTECQLKLECSTRKNTELEHNLQSAMSMINHLKGNNSMEQSSEWLQSKLEAVTQERDTYKQDLERIQIENMKLKQNLFECKDKINLQIQKIAADKELNNEIEQEMDRLGNGIDKLVHQMGDVRKEMDKTTQIVYQTKTTVTHYKKQNETLMKSIEIIPRIRLNLQRELDNIISLVDNTDDKPFILADIQQNYQRILNQLQEEIMKNEEIKNALKSMAELNAAIIEQLKN